MNYVPDPDDLSRIELGFALDSMLYFTRAH